MELARVQRFLVRVEWLADLTKVDFFFVLRGVSGAGTSPPVSS